MYVLDTILHVVCGRNRISLQGFNTELNAKL